MNKIAIYLNRHITGNVFDNDSILEAYSVDDSLLKIKPRFVALPESTSDIRKIVKFVNQLAEKKYYLPISVRGSGLSKSGADLSNGIIISTEKLNHVRELDAHDRLVHVQAGITLGKLNAVLAPYGLTIPVFANPNDTIGSLINTCPRDKYSNKYGGIVNYIDRVEVVLSNGDLLQTSRLSKGKLNGKIRAKGYEGEIYKKVQSLLTEKQEQLDNIKNTREGYTGAKHIVRNNGSVFDMLPIFFASEGTLGIITEVILRAVPSTPRPHRIFATFPNLESATKFADFCLEKEPLSVEIFDNKIFQTAEEFGKKPDLLSKKIENGYLVLASFNDKSRKSRKKVRKCQKFSSKSNNIIIETLDNSQDFDDFETSLISFLNDDPKTERPNLLNDFYLPKENLNKFIEEIKKIEKKYKKTLSLFGSYDTENFSLRPSFELKKVEERRTALSLLQELNTILKALDGNLTGGYPEGRLKSIVTYPDLAKDLKETYAKIKEIFDPNNILGPESKTNYDTRSAVRHLRTETNQGIIS